MGNDGGSIPTRRELVKEAARNPTTSELKESQHEQQQHNWTTDPISNAPLARPVVSDSSGRLYNKDTILEYLVEGTRKEEADKITDGAIKSLKDIVEVKFELDTEATETKKTKHEIWKCPITNARLGPGSKASYIVPCGHAFSGAAMREVSTSKCLSCDTEFAPNDVIPILSLVDTDIARLSLRVQTLKERGLAHSLKKASKESKKRKKRDEKEEAANGEAVKNGSGIPVNGSKPENESRINNSSTASLTAKVMEEQERAKKRKMENSNVKSLFSSKDKNGANGQNTDFMTRGFSVPAKR